jgi:hypothetical protein
MKSTGEEVEIWVHVAVNSRRLKATCEGCSACVFSVENLEEVLENLARHLKGYVMDGGELRVYSKRHEESVVRL